MDLHPFVLEQSLCPVTPGSLWLGIHLNIGWHACSPPRLRRRRGFGRPFPPPPDTSLTAPRSPRLRRRRGFGRPFPPPPDTSLTAPLPLFPTVCMPIHSSG